MKTKTQKPLVIPHFPTVSLKRSILRYRLIIIITCMLFLLLMLFQQPTFPAPWFDEGLNASTAAMLAKTGLYALPDSTGPRMFDPAIQTGPTVIIPIALVYRFFGIGMLEARMVMLVFAIFTLFAYGLMARAVVGANAALLAIVFLLIGSLQEYSNFIMVARQILGEVPALGYYAFGIFIWLYVIEHSDKRIAGLILSGLVWGIAMVTKSQILLVWPICLGLLMILDLFYYRQAGIQAFLIPGFVMVLCVLAWYAVQISILGIDGYQQNAVILREGFALHIISLNSNHWRNAMSVIWQTGWWLWGAPGLAWGLWQAHKRNIQGFRHAMALALPIVSLFWFLLLSVGWGRYAFYPITISYIWLAALLTEIWKGHFIYSKHKAHKIFVLSMLMVYIFINVLPQSSRLVQSQDSGYMAMRDYLHNSLPGDALIETWAWEMIDVPQPMHHPSTHTTNIATQYIWTHHIMPPKDFYTEYQPESQYILANSFSTWTGIYDTILQDQSRAQHIVSFGTYSLYRLLQ